MPFALHPNQITNQPQENIRIADLRRWMYMHNVTFVDMGRVCGVTAAAVTASLNRARMPVRHHTALTGAYPDLPAELLPEPRDVPTGPRPKFMRPQADT